MATHDYVIDNSTGANVRADINNVLQAILTNNSSSSAPSTTAAYMWWADTTSGILKIRNSANNGWVELLQLDGTLTLEDGSKTAPALAHRSNLNTGIFFSAANKFNVSTAGVERLELGTTTIFNEEGADVDFRIEGDDEQNLFYVDASTDRIGIGTSSPSTNFHVKGSGTDILKIESTDPGAQGTNLILQHSPGDGNMANNDVVSLLQFNGVDNSNASVTYASIRTVATNVANNSETGDLTFHTRNGSTFGERVRINNLGRVGIGTTSPSNNLHVATSSNGKGISVISSGDTYSDLNFSADRSGAGNHIARIQGQWNGGNVAQIIFNAGGDTQSKDDGEIGLATSNGGSSPTYRLYIKQDGKIGIGTTSPSTLLDVAGSFHVSSQILNERGTASAPPFSFGDDSDTGMFNDANAALGFSVGGLERVRINSSGNVGIGSTNPQSSMHLKSMSGVLSVSTYPQLTIETAATDGGAHKGGAILFLNHNGNAGTFGGSIQCLKENATVGNTANYMRFCTRPAGGDNNEHMRIDSSGRVGIGTSSFDDAREMIRIKNTGGDGTFLTIEAPTDSGSSEIFFADSDFNRGRIAYEHNTDDMEFFVSDSKRLTIDTNGNIGAPTGTNIYNASDLRLKKNVADLNKGLSVVKSLRPVSFNWIDGFCDKQKDTLYGFIAQEVETVDSNLIEEFGNGSVIVKGQAIDDALRVNEKFIIPMLVKAIQELSAKVEALEAG